MTGDTPEPGWWAPIVYARTRDVDMWWRALPPQMRRDGPEAQALDATIADDGAQAPRLVLGRLPTGTLLGVACQTHRISQDMRSDSGRPVSCFVGWLCTDKRVTVPQFDAVESGWVTWAAAEYERWMRPVWLESARRVRETDQTGALRPPWELTGTPPDTDPWDRSEFEAPPPDGVRVYPAADAARVWRGIDRYGVDATVVTGWISVRTALRHGLTHACVEEFHGAMRIWPRPPAKPAGGTRAAAHRPRPARDDAYAATARGYGADVPAYGKPPYEMGRDRAVPRGPDAGYAGAGEREASGSGTGWFGGVFEHGKRAAHKVQDLAASVVGGDPGPRQPPAPPARDAEWTLQPDHGVFMAWQGGYVFGYRIGDPAIVCWPEGHPDQRFQWTGTGWAPLMPPRPPRPEPRQQQPRPPAPGWKPAAPPKAAGSPFGSSPSRPPVPEPSPAHAAPLDEFEDAPLPDRRPVPPDDEPGGAQDAPAEGSPAQTTPPEWSPEE